MSVDILLPWMMFTACAYSLPNPSVPWPREWDKCPDRQGSILGKLSHKLLTVAVIWPRLELLACRLELDSQFWLGWHLHGGGGKHCRAIQEEDKGEAEEDCQGTQLELGRHLLGQGGHFPSLSPPNHSYTNRYRLCGIIITVQLDSYG